MRAAGDCSRFCPVGVADGAGFEFALARELAGVIPEGAPRRPCPITALERAGSLAGVPSPGHRAKGDISSARADAGAGSPGRSRRWWIAAARYGVHSHPLSLARAASRPVCPFPARAAWPTGHPRTSIPAVPLTRGQRVAGEATAGGRRATARASARLGLLMALASSSRWRGEVAEVVPEGAARCAWPGGGRDLPARGSRAMVVATGRS